MQDGDTALSLASWNGHIAVVKELLAFQANVNVQDNVSHDIIVRYTCKVSHFFSGHCKLTMAQVHEYNIIRILLCSCK